MKDLNIPKYCKNCIKGEHEYPCSVCGPYNRFEPNPMFDEVYERGARDMYDAAKKIIGSFEDGGYSSSELREIFDAVTLLNIMSEYDPIEIINKIQNYEENKKTLHVGDVIKTDACCCGIVTKIDNCCNEYKYCILWRDGSVGHHKHEYIIKDKTGENMTIPEFLEKYGRIGE